MYQTYTNSTVKYLRHCLTNMPPLHLNLYHNSTRTTSTFQLDEITDSSDQSVYSNPLYIPQVKTKAGTRAFSVAAPTLCNSLPATVKLEGNIVSFRRRLNSYHVQADTSTFYCNTNR